MTGESHTTTDHETIRQWAEPRQGRPARVKDTERSDDDVGVLRIAFDTDRTAPSTATSAVSSGLCNATDQS